MQSLGLGKQTCYLVSSRVGKCLLVWAVRWSEVKFLLFAGMVTFSVPCFTPTSSQWLLGISSLFEFILFYWFYLFYLFIYFNPLQVISNGDVMPPFIFPRSLRLNMEAYIKCLKELVLSWIKRVVVERPYVWQQDAAQCYTNRRNQSWLKEDFYNHITPII